MDYNELIRSKYIWAKYEKRTESSHPLICHLIDSGNVFLHLWEDVLPASTQNLFCKLFDLDPISTKKLLRLLVSLHDIGKASSAFQALVPQFVPDLQERGFKFPAKGFYLPKRHDLISAWWVRDCFAKLGIAQGKDVKEIASVLGAHHGFFYSSSDLHSRQRILNMGSEEWVQLRQALYALLYDLIQPPQKFEMHGEPSHRQSALVLLSGLIVVSDWLASDENLFPFQSQDGFSLEEYDQVSTEHAITALQKTGWLAWSADDVQHDFNSLFNVSAPYPIQQETIDVAEEIDTPFLAIIEAQTGQGKTEAALYLADHTIQSASLKGLYIAMPTMATSNQMFDRASDFLAHRYPDQIINNQLAHSQARWNDAYVSMKLDSIGADMQDQQGVFALSWFLPNKKTLLAPFGVGTVDQALMSVLKTKHYFLRLFGLANKVLIFDEVHAYDLYMSTLFIRLLEWLKRLGCSVIVLSATLPKNMKEEMAAVYCENLASFSGEAYPCLTVAQEQQVVERQPSSHTDQCYYLESISYEPLDICKYLQEKLREGGNAAVICNTVARAQQVYQALKNSDLFKSQSADDDELILFHARFPHLWRDAIEQCVVDKYKRNEKRPHRSVVVATQVIEQSLDLDFDLMVTDLAPIDLLIQRAGRVHRHQRGSRPPGLHQARLCIAMPPPDEEEIDFGSSKNIYDEDILLKTYFQLLKMEQLHLPVQTRDLIERVYDPARSDWLTPAQLVRISQVMEKIELQRQREKNIALDKLIPLPDDESLLVMGRLYLEEDDPQVHRAFQALTRLISPSVSLVCMQQQGDAIFTLNGNEIDSLDDVPESAHMQEISRSIVNISRWSVINHFWEHVHRPESWQKNAVLRNCYPILFKEGVCHLKEGLDIVLNKEIGMQIMEEK